MVKKRVFRQLSALLVLLMLADSSLALEMLAHDHMAGGDSHLASLLHGDVHDVTSAMHGDVYGMTSAMPTESGNQGSEAAAAEAPDEDCLCDEICCIGSLNLLNSSDAVFLYRLAEESQKASLLYQSVKLDLRLPPPIR